jgi:hypothetical protein
MAAVQNGATLAADMQRRRLLQIGLGAGALLALAGGSVALVQPGLVDGHVLSPRARGVMAAVARAVLEGSLPAGDSARAQVLQAHLHRVQQTIDGLPRHAQRELSLLLALLGSAPGRMGLAGLSSDWPEASVPQLQAALESMRMSSLAMRQQAFLALRELTNASYYADPGTWALLGYPGPNAV